MKTEQELKDALLYAYHWGRDKGEGISEKNFNDMLKTSWAQSLLTKQEEHPQVNDGSHTIAELRDKLITGNFMISDGIKQPLSWQQYAIKLEDEYLSLKQANAEWISVEDRSPYYDPIRQAAYHILMAASNGRQYTGYSVTEYGETKFFRPNGRQVLRVTHWMPLPKHPEELPKHDKQ